MALENQERLCPCWPQNPAAWSLEKSPQVSRSAVHESKFKASSLIRRYYSRMAITEAYLGGGGGKEGKKGRSILLTSLCRSKTLWGCCLAACKCI